MKKRKKEAEVDSNVVAPPQKKIQRAPVPEEAEPKEADQSGSSTLESSIEPVRPTFLSGSRFADLPLSEGTQAALAALGFNFMTKIQEKSIGPLLAGKDLLGAAKTGPSLPYY